jgi:hypothetical protein
MAGPQQTTSDPYAEFGGAVAADNPYADFGGDQGGDTSGERIQPRGHHLVGPGQYLSSPFDEAYDEVGRRVEGNLRPLLHPVDFAKDAYQSVKDYRAQRDPNQGNWFTRGIGVLGKGASDLASDYWQHPTHILGDAASAAILHGATSEPEVIQPRASTGSTEGIPWGTGGKGPLALRGKMIPPPEPPAVYPGASLPAKPPTSFLRGNAPVYPGGSLPGTPAPELLNPALASQSRSLPGMIGREVIRPPAQPIPPRSGLMLPAGEAAPESDIEALRRGAPDRAAEQAEIARTHLESKRAQLANAHQDPNVSTGDFIRARNEVRNLESPVEVTERPPEKVEALKTRKAGQPRIASPSAPANLDLRMSEMLDQVGKEPPTVEAGPSAAERAQARLGPPKQGTRIPGPNEDLTPLLRQYLEEVETKKPN